MATKATFYVLLRGRRGRLRVVTAQEAMHAPAHCSLVLCPTAVPGLSAEAARGAAAACEGSRFCCVDTVGALYTATGAIAHSHTRYRRYLNGYKCEGREESEERAWLRLVMACKERGADAPIPSMLATVGIAMVST